MKRGRRLAGALLLVTVTVLTSAGSCGDGNPSDSPSKGFDKCLNHANC